MKHHYTLCRVLVLASLIGATVPAGAQTYNHDAPPTLLAPGESPDAPAVLVPPNSNLGASTIGIIQSQHINPGHDMDIQWSNVITAMGLNATILTQPTLNSLAGIIGYDAVIVSSGVATYPAAQVASIVAYIQSGRSVYLQGEYQCSQPGTIAFGNVLAGLGLGWTCGGTTNGDLQPMPVIGPLASTPNAIPPLSYYWYGAYGSGGSQFQSFLSKSGLDYGFKVTPGAPNGSLIFDTDQDWKRVPSQTSLPLMENIVVCLLSSAPTPARSVSWGNVKIMYR